MTYPIYNEMMFAFVSGLESAKTYQIPYGRSALLMDTDKPMFYVKSTNSTGQIVLQAYEFKEVKLKEQTNSEFVTKEQFDDLNTKLDTILKNMKGDQNEQSNISTKPTNQLD